MFDGWVDGQVLAVVEAAHRHVAMAMARQLAGIAELLERRMAEELGREADTSSMITGFNRTAVEVGGACQMVCV